MQKYLFLASLNYAFPILRPLQEAIRRRGADVAWFIDNPDCVKYLKEGETHLKTYREVLDYDPVTVFTPGNHMYNFFPGTKVEVFHGFSIDKRPGRGDHYDIKGWFDLFCTNDSRATPVFQSLSDKYKSFKAIETGWTKLDAFFDESGNLIRHQNQRPTILYCSTFTKWITSTPYLYNDIEKIVQSREWDWLITFHPLMDKETVDRYKSLQDKYDNVTFVETDNNIELLQKADVMLCDSSSIIFEFMYLDKPVVTYKNTAPGDYLIDIDDPAKLEASLELALTYPPDLMGRIRKKMDEIHPYRDGRSSDRVLDAVDIFNADFAGNLRNKKPGLVRKWKAARKLHYPVLLNLFK